MGLPPGSLVWHLAGVDSAWSVTDHLLAVVADALHGANWQRSGGKGSQPEPIPRPADATAAKTKVNLALARAAAFRARAAGGGGGRG